MLSIAVRSLERLVLILLFTVSISGCIQPISPSAPAGCDGKCPCMSDSDCSGATPRCDRNSGACVPCLPLSDNCPMGGRCIAENGAFRCTSSCVVAGDCPQSDAGVAQSCCKGACLDLANDLANCGACGNTCAPYRNATTVCAFGKCTLARCDPGFSNCDGIASNGCEVATTTDVRNCGMCGRECTTGVNATVACAGSNCVVTCSMNYGDCDKNAVNGCEAALLTDVNNCGACGLACAMLPNAQVTCTAAVCAIGACTGGFSDCNGKVQDGCEVNTLADLANCGGCGKPCKIANGVGACNAGACTIASCNMNYRNCDAITANGCEAALLTDPLNCGACGHTCSGPNSTQDCEMGACVLTNCAPGFSDCNNDPSDGCEVNLNSDVANCGGCGGACARVQNGVPACVNAKCGIGSCNFGYAHCSNDPMDGCEVSLLTDPNNCGQCRTMCSVPPNASAGCAAAKCGIGMCNKLWGDCDKLVANGCEQNLAADVKNCGACGKVCAAANAVPSCLNGQCGILQCNQGFGDCDMNAVNGCEANLNTDVSNCGKCGTVCPMNAPNCIGGACTSAIAIMVEGHADVGVPCALGDFNCQAHNVCNQVTGQSCVYQNYDCYFGNQGSWYAPAEGAPAGINFAITYDLLNGSGNICCVNIANCQKYGLATNHVAASYGHWVRR